MVTRYTSSGGDSSIFCLPPCNTNSFLSEDPLFPVQVSKWEVTKIVSLKIRYAEFIQKPRAHKDYGKCPKNSNTKPSDKMTCTNSVDPDQTAEGAV